MKAKIQETQGDDFPATSMNIIYQGKVRTAVAASARTAAPAVPLSAAPSCRCCCPSGPPPPLSHMMHADPEG